MAAPILHGEKLLNGNRLANCSAKAQLFFPRILLCANGYGRFEIDLSRIRDVGFRTFKRIGPAGEEIDERPTEKEIVDALGEYQKNFLLCVYGHGGQFWGQFDVPANLLPDHKTKADQMSPEPPEGEMERMRGDYEHHKRTNSPAASMLRALVIAGEPKTIRDLETPGNNFQLLAKEVVGEVVVEKKKTAAAVEIPGWVPSEPWQAFVEMRKKIRFPLTDYAIKQAIRELDKLRARGHPPEAVLNQSVLNSYRGLFEVKQGGNHSGQVTPINSKPRDAREILRERQENQ